MECRDHEWLPLALEAEMADESSVEDRVDRGAVVGPQVVDPLDAGAGGRGSGTMCHGPQRIRVSGRDRARRDECPSPEDVGRERPIAVDWRHGVGDDLDICCSTAPACARSTGAACAIADRVKLADSLLRTFLEQMLQEGVFHADPHPGNVMLLTDGQLALIDFGAAGRLDPVQQAALRELMAG